MKGSGWKKKMRRGLAAACLAVGLTMAGWGGSAVDKAEAMLEPTASYSVSVTPNHLLNDVYIGFSYYLNTSVTNTEVFKIADSINEANAAQNFTGNLYGDIDWTRTIKYVVLGVYDNNNGLVTVGFDSNWATSNALEHSWEAIFTDNSIFSDTYSESQIAQALKTGDTETLANFISSCSDFENRWADNGAASTLVKFSDGEAGGTAWAEATPVPIPGAVWLLGSGLIGLVAIRRRKPKA